LLRVGRTMTLLGRCAPDGEVGGVVCMMVPGMGDGLSCEPPCGPCDDQCDRARAVGFSARVSRLMLAVQAKTIFLDHSTRYSGDCPWTVRDRKGGVARPRRGVLGFWATKVGDLSKCVTVGCTRQYGVQ